MEKKQILLTNDDGINSPGIWAAAQALSTLGYVTLAAPREQYSGAGRSLPLGSDGKIQPTTLKIGDQEWTCYAIGGSPAQAVLHAVLEIMPQKPDLVVSGINYGENVGHSLTASGTVGAALEGASLGIPSIAVSLQLLRDDYLSYHTDIDFSAAAYFTALMARAMLEQALPPDVDVLKIEVPADATTETPWRLARLAHHRYWLPSIDRKGLMEEKAVISGYTSLSPDEVSRDSDAYALVFDHVVAVTPLSLDMTSRIDLEFFERDIRRWLRQS